MGISPDANLLFEQGSQKKVTKISAKAVSRLSKYSVRSKPLRYEKDLAIYHSPLSKKLHYPPSPLRTYTTEDGYMLSVTDDVLCLTLNGWRPFGELQVGDTIQTNGIDTPMYMDKESLKRLYIDEDMTEQEVADYCGVSARTIRAYVKKFGLGKGQGPKLFGENNPNWKGDNVSKRGGYERTRMGYSNLKTGVCSRCGRVLPTQIHHNDRNPVNTDGNNLIELCDLCHAAEHHGMVIKWTRPAKITEIRYGGISESWGFLMEDGDNFIAEGFILRCPEESADKVDILEKL